ncbi:hypothetical protein QBC46DRAFT_339048 [Diplogelasinospora grovesii]|uniref:Uncharacterized protein n=1 Tax=Diplogelasinospora grovesii TaxID=303347 RepID=A0AAN6NBM2_9PEZI|nr:hypothetical protein QBC46DRAFT_339048 [Diplogelasinospora grovesii]
MAAITAPLSCVLDEALEWVHSNFHPLSEWAEAIRGLPFIRNILDWVRSNYETVVSWVRSNVRAILSWIPSDLVVVFSDLVFMVAGMAAVYTVRRLGASIRKRIPFTGNSVPDLNPLTNVAELGDSTSDKKHPFQETLDDLYDVLETLTSKSPDSGFEDFASFFAEDCIAYLHPEREEHLPPSVGRAAIIQELKRILGVYRLNRRRVVRTNVFPERYTTAVVSEMENRLVICEDIGYQSFDEEVFAVFDNNTGLIRRFEVDSDRTPIVFILRTDPQVDRVEVLHGSFFDVPEYWDAKVQELREQWEIEDERERRRRAMNILEEFDARQALIDGYEAAIEGFRDLTQSARKMGEQLDQITREIKKEKKEDREFNRFKKVLRRRYGLPLPLPL